MKYDKLVTNKKIFYNKQKNFGGIMKKLCWILVFGIIIMSGLSAYACFGRHKGINKGKTRAASEFEILPTMDTESNAKNTVWVGTFQLIWNDLMDEIIHNPVEFAGEKSVMAGLLNKKSFMTNDLNESSYYKKLGLASYELKKEIEQGIKSKFNEKSDILDKFNWAPAKGKYILYAMLKKDFEYIKTFDKLEDGEFVGSKGLVKYFGIDRNSRQELRHTVKVLFYNGDDDYAVALTSKQGDIVYLYRTDDKNTFDKLYEGMMKKAESYMGIRSFGKKDELKIPLLDFKKEREFKELCNKPIKNSDYMIMKALETVQFKMTEAGVKLKSEAGMMVALTCAPSFRDEPRYFYFNNRYVIFLQEKDKPYFAMKIEDAKTLQGK